MTKTYYRVDQETVHKLLDWATDFIQDMENGESLKVRASQIMSLLSCLSQEIEPINPMADILTLEDLREAMLLEEDSVMECGKWRSDLPTFGGEAPSDTRGIWSWDAQNLLIGTCAEDLRIVPRSGKMKHYYATDGNVVVRFTSESGRRRWVKPYINRSPLVAKHLTEQQLARAVEACRVCDSALPVGGGDTCEACPK